jgi:hypothetical protein
LNFKYAIDGWSDANSEYASIAAYWIAFGPHGPRAETPKGEGMRIVVQLMKYLAVSAALFYAVRLAANPPPRTMTKEWQEATNEYALVRIFLVLYTTGEAFD